MISIVNSAVNLTLERMLAMYGMEHFCIQTGTKRNFKVYGCGVFVPGEAYDGFVNAYSNGELLGVIGLTIEEQSLNAHEGTLRQQLGQILMRAPKIFTTDQVSSEWAPHYDIQYAQHGGHPAWLADSVYVKRSIKERSGVFLDVDNLADIQSMLQHTEYIVIHDGGETIGAIATTLGACIAAALLEVPVIIAPDNSGMGHKSNAVGNHPLVRFANRFNVSVNVAIELSDLKVLLDKMKNGQLRYADSKLVEAAKIEAYSTLEKMVPQQTDNKSNQIDDALAVFGTISERVVESPNSNAPVASTGPKIINHGDPFDPSTHYDKYYYGDGPGLIYHDANGNKARYSGPGRDWEGFDTVADIFSMIFPVESGRKTLVSLGCGFGNDVKRFRRHGWDAWGCDISTWSVGAAEPEVKDFIILGNVMDRRVQEQLPESPSVVCTFDFWEHIFLRDIDTLLQQLYFWMPPGSCMANIICTLGRQEKDITINPGDCFTAQNSWFLISGHVTGRRWHWWANKFSEHGFKPDMEKSYMFQVARSEDPSMSQALSWRARNLLIVTRED